MQDNPTFDHIIGHNSPTFRLVYISPVETGKAHLTVLSILFTLIL